MRTNLNAPSTVHAGVLAQQKCKRHPSLQPASGVATLTIQFVSLANEV